MLLSIFKRKSKRLRTHTRFSNAYTSAWTYWVECTEGLPGTSQEGLGWPVHATARLFLKLATLWGKQNLRKIQRKQSPRFTRSSYRRDGDWNLCLGFTCSVKNPMPGFQGAFGRNPLSAASPCILFFSQHPQTRCGQNIMKTVKDEGSGGAR